MIIKELSEAIVNKFRQCQELNSALSGIYFKFVPQNTSLPYLVFDIVDIDYEQYLGDRNSRLYKIEVKFSLYVNFYDGGYDMTSLMEGVTNCYDLKNFAIENYSLVKFGLDRISPAMYIGDVMQTDLLYECWIIRS